MSCSICLHPGVTAYVTVYVREKSIDPTTRAEVLTPITGATVTITIRDAEGVNIAGVSWPVSLTHDELGSYEGTIPGDAALVDGKRVRVYIEVSDSDRQWNTNQAVVPQKAPF